MRARFRTDDGGHIESDMSSWVDSSKYISSRPVNPPAYQSSEASEQAVDTVIDVPSELSVFTHILRYLRTGILPVLWDQQKGHDYAVYTAIACDAEKLGIPRLSRWITESRYLEVVKIVFEQWGPEAVVPLKPSLRASTQREYHAVLPTTGPPHRWMAIDRRIEYDHSLPLQWGTEYLNQR